MSELFEREKTYTLFFRVLSLKLFREGIGRLTDWTKQWQRPGNATIDRTLERYMRIASFLEREAAKGQDDFDLVTLQIEGDLLVQLKSTLPYLLRSLENERSELAKMEPPKDAFEAIDSKINAIKELMGSGMMNQVPVEEIMGTLEAGEKRTVNTDGGVYDVALSFAGEDRLLVQQVANELQGRGIKVFFDAYETATLWGKDLGQHFDDVFRKKSGFVMLFISRHYVEKPWPQHEFRSALSKAIQEKKEFLLPIRLDDAELIGLQPSVAYITQTDPKKIVELFLAKRQSMQS